MTYLCQSYFFLKLIESSGANSISPKIKIPPNSVLTNTSVLVKSVLHYVGGVVVVRYNWIDLCKRILFVIIQFDRIYLLISYQFIT